MVYRWWTQSQLMLSNPIDEPSANLPDAAQPGAVLL